MNKVPKILCLTTMVLFLLVILQGATHLRSFKPLKGVYVGAEKPQLTLSEVMAGRYQAALEQYAKEHHGLREWSIRTYNQYLYTVYRQSSNPGVVVVGKKGYLFEPWFVDEYYTDCFAHFYADSIPEYEKELILHKRMSRLGKLQAILEEQGVHLFLAMLPGKERIYPQYLPDRGAEARSNRTFGHHRAYDTYRLFAADYGIRQIDLCHCFDSLKGQTPYLLFTQTGTHWSNIASTYAFDSVMRFMQTFGPAIRPVALGQPYYGDPREPDADLDELLNKALPIPVERNQYVDVALAEPAPERTPSLVVIGDSFFWNVLYNFPVQELFSDFRYWYYFSTIYYDPEQEHVADIDLVEELLGSDYVMLSYCTVQLYDMGNGFVNRALLELCYDPEEIQAVRDSLAADTSSSLSVEERLDRNLEHYFPELAVPGVPSVRCSRLRKK